LVDSFEWESLSLIIIIIIKFFLSVNHYYYLRYLAVEMTINYYYYYVFMHRALWYYYTTHTNEMHEFLNYYLIFDVFYTFRTAWVRPQIDRQLCVQYGMFTCTGVSRTVSLPTHQTTHTDSCIHTVLHKQLSFWGWSYNIRNK
jgi:hypothetical protein